MELPIGTAQGFYRPVFGAYTVPPFQFQARHESMDWRRISAVDVERVIRELDVATLQENITSITLCNLDREACIHCGKPMDTALLKVLRLAQLSIEYLVHCHNSMRTSIAQLEARLQASLDQQERGQQELGRQAEELKGVRKESHERRKMISTLQNLLQQTGGQFYHTCHQCDKMFVNATFLQSHIQRRHESKTEGDPTEKQKKQEKSVEEAIEELRAKLKSTQEELEALKEEKQQRQEAETTSQRERDANQIFDNWKEMLSEEMHKQKKSFWDEMKSSAFHNSLLEEIPGDDFKEQHQQALKGLQALKEKIEIQDTKWKMETKKLLEEFEVEAVQLREENRTLRDENRTLRDENRTLRKEKRTLQEENRTLQEENRALQEENRTLQEENRTLHKKNRMMLKENRTLQKENRTLQEEKRTLQEEKRTLQEDNETLQIENEMLQSENKTLQKENKMLQEENKTVQKENKTVQKENKTVQKENKTVQKENKTVQKENRTLQEENSTLQQENNMLQREKEVLQKNKMLQENKVLQENKMLQEEIQRLRTSLSQVHKAAAPKAQRQRSATLFGFRRRARHVASQEEMSQTVCHRKEEEWEDSSDEQEEALEAPKRKRSLLKRIKRALQNAIPDRRDSRTSPAETDSLHQQVRWVQREEEFAHFLSPREKLVRKAPGGAEVEQNKASVAQTWSQVSLKSQQSLLVTKEVQSKTSTQHEELPSKLAGPPLLIPHSYGSHGPGFTQVPTRMATPRADGNFRTPVYPVPKLSSEQDWKRISGRSVFPDPSGAPTSVGPQSEDNWNISNNDPLEGSSQAPDHGTHSRPYTVRRVLVMSRQEWEQAKKVAEGASVPLPGTAPPQAATTTEGKPQLSDDVSHFKENVLQNAPQNPGQKEEWKMPEKQAVSTFTRRRHKICHW